MSRCNSNSGLRNSKSKQKLLKSKPFCDCSYCKCANCPDILKLLSIHVTDTTCRFGPKVKYDEDNNDQNPPEAALSQDLLNIINQIKQEPCSCEVVARGVRDHVHMNLGLTKRREQIILNSNEKPQCQPEKPTPKPSKIISSTTPKPPVPEESKTASATEATAKRNCTCCTICPKEQ